MSQSSTTRKQSDYKKKDKTLPQWVPHERRYSDAKGQETLHSYSYPTLHFSRKHIKQY